MTGRIYKALSGFFYVDTQGGLLTCRARGKFRKTGVSPLVGDRVECTALGGGEGVIESIQLKLLLDNASQAVYAAPQVGIPCCQIDFSRGKIL